MDTVNPAKSAILAFLKQWAHQSKRAYVTTREIAEGISLTNKQVGFWMGELIRGETPGLRIIRRAKRNRRGGRGSVWEVRLI
jgi:hypothetical protein